MKEKIFYAFDINDPQTQTASGDGRVAMRLVAAPSRSQAKAFLARHYGGRAWTVVSCKEIHKGLVAG